MHEAEPLSPLGKVALIQKNLGCGDDSSVFEGPDGWIIIGRLGMSAYYVSRITGLVRVSSLTRWEDMDVT